ncbi:OLC1v1000975C1 [Oldenlandia corymbosa var. corymbosa]|uniref:OLC1v1000975C1 n=1 Tax=Oldenlandia corymbosa var. corymbosa TaxID=529605 RepID=A0AAV1D725_OLDCO|nr:OLC1v1000975C1 [Oldenlandia corymbosa var. corymbosa]
MASGLGDNNKKGGRKDQWEEIKCPICLHHPHQAVLLICSSHEKGCRPFLCDTNRQLSNCFDQFCKYFSVSPSKPSNNHNQDQPNQFLPCGEKGQEVRCPLCRSQITGWTIVKGARALLNKKVRNCPLDSCKVSGKYSDLKKHANREHPAAVPSDSDDRRKEQERKWVEEGLFVEDLDDYETDVDFLLEHPDLYEDLVDNDDEVNAVYLRPGETYIGPDGAEISD